MQESTTPPPDAPLKELVGNQGYVVINFGIAVCRSFQGSSSMLLSLRGRVSYFLGVQKFVWDVAPAC